MTIEQIKADENFLCGIELPDHNFKAYLIFQGSDILKYYAFHKDVLIFEGNDYTPSPLFSGYDSLESMATLVGLLCTQHGDVGDDFFAAYTPDQIEWRDSNECEELSYVLGDYFYDTEDNEYHKGSVDTLNAAFIQG